MKRIILIIIFILSLTVPAHSDYMNDLIITGTSGIWTDSRAFSSLSDAVTAMGANERDLYIAEPETVTDLTIPATVRLHFLRTGSITYSGQLTINTKQIDAEDQQIFTRSGSGDVDFSPGSVIKSSWFSSFPEAINQTSDDSITLVISKSAFVTSTCAVGNNVTLQWLSPNTRLTANAGVTLSNIKNIEAGNFQLFAGAGNFAFLDGTKLKLDWFARLRSAINWIGNSKVTLVVSGSNTVDYSDTSPSNISYDMNSESGILSLSAGVTLTINGNFISSPKQSISGDGTVTFGTGSVRVFYPEWWGENSTPGTTDMTAEIQAAINAATGPTAGYDAGIVSLSGTTYTISSTLNIKSGVKLTGVGQAGTVIDNNGSGYAITNTGTNTAGYGWEIANLKILGDGTNGGIYTVGSGGSTPRTSWIRHINMTNIGTRGIYLADCSYIKIDSVGIGLASGASAYGIYLGGGSVGKELTYFRNVNIAGAGASGSTGVYLESGNNFSFYDLDVNDCGYGIHIVSGDMRVYNSNISRAITAAIYLDGTNSSLAYNTFRDITINMLGSSINEIGIKLSRSGGHLVYNNIFDHVQFYVLGATHPTYYIDGNDAGVQSNEFLRMDNRTNGAINVAQYSLNNFTFLLEKRGYFSVFDGNGSTTSFACTLTATSPWPFAPSIIANTNQTIAYSISKSNTPGGNLILTITFASAPTTGTGNVWIYWQILGQI